MVQALFHSQHVETGEVTVKAGQRFGKLTTIKEIDRPDGRRWQCHCDCGNTSFVRSHYLSIGRTRSCGCAIGEHQKLRKLDRSEVIEIRKSVGPLKLVAKQYSIDPSLVSRIRRGLRSAHIK